MPYSWKVTSIERRSVGLRVVVCCISIKLGGQIPQSSHKILPLLNSPGKYSNPKDWKTMLSILRKARLKDKEMRILMLYEPPIDMQDALLTVKVLGVWIMRARPPL